MGLSVLSPHPPHLWVGSDDSAWEPGLLPWPGCWFFESDVPPGPVAEEKAGCAVCDWICVGPCSLSSAQGSLSPSAHAGLISVGRHHSTSCDCAPALLLAVQGGAAAEPLATLSCVTLQGTPCCGETRAGLQGHAVWPTLLDIKASVGKGWWRRESSQDLAGLQGPASSAVIMSTRRVVMRAVSGAGRA
jgi:hypothetical protein